MKKMDINNKFKELTQEELDNITLDLMNTDNIKYESIKRKLAIYNIINNTNLTLRSLGIDCSENPKDFDEYEFFFYGKRRSFGDSNNITLSKIKEYRKMYQEFIGIFDTFYTEKCYMTEDDKIISIEHKPDEEYKGGYLKDEEYKIVVVEKGKVSAIEVECDFKIVKEVADSINLDYNDDIEIMYMIYKSASEYMCKLGYENTVL